MNLISKIKNWFGSNVDDSTSAKPNEDLKEETRIIECPTQEVVINRLTLNEEKSNAYIAYVLKRSIDESTTKAYKNLLQFIGNYASNADFSGVRFSNVQMTLNEDSVKLLKKMYFLNYKSTDDAVKSLISWGKQLSEK